MKSLAFYAIAASLLAGCAAAEPLSNPPLGFGAGFDPANPETSAPVEVRPIAQEDRDYFRQNSPERRAELAAIFAERRASLEDE